MEILVSVVDVCPNEVAKVVLNFITSQNLKEVTITPNANIGSYLAIEKIYETIPDIKIRLHLPAKYDPITSTFVGTKDAELMNESTSAGFKSIFRDNHYKVEWSDDHNGFVNALSAIAKNKYKHTLVFGLRNAEPSVNNVVIPSECITIHEYDQ